MGDDLITVLFTDDFESKYSFHPVEDFPAPEEYKHLQRVYPSKTNRGARVVKTVSMVVCSAACVLSEVTCASEHVDVSGCLLLPPSDPGA